MKKVKLVIRHNNSQGFVDWRVIDADTDLMRAEVQAFTLSYSIDDVAPRVILTCIDFTPYDEGCTDTKAIEDASKGLLREFTEEVEVVSIDMKRE